MKTTTLNQIKEHNPCASGWKKLLAYLGKTKADDEPLAFGTILKSNGVEDAIWCLCALPFTEQRLFKADIAESVLHIFEEQYPDDKRPRLAIESLRAEPFDTDAADAAHAAYAADAARAAADAAHAAAAYTAARAAAHAAYAAYAAAAYAAAYVTANTAARAAGSWEEIEQLFVKHYC